MAESKNEIIKRKTIELYDQLPQEKEARMKRTDIRDQVIDLNYTFFGYIASHTFINNSSVTYEDKLQSALMHFCECWYWYRWEGHYRTDLSFGVFFKPRIGEMIERELNEVKYSIRRSLCMEVGQQLGKHWGQVRYEDLSDPRLHLSIDKMNSLKAMFGSLYIADLDDHEMYTPAPVSRVSEFEEHDDKYNSIEEFLMNEMIEKESKLTERELHDLANMMCIEYNILKAALPRSEKMLYKKLHDSLDLIED